MAPLPEGWESVAGRIRLAGSLPVSTSLDSGMTAFLHCCSGERLLRDIFDELVREQGWDATQMAPVFLRVVTNLIERGFLQPATT